MGDLRSPPTVTHPPPSPTRSNVPMLYYGLVVIATAAIMLVLYNLVIIKWCTDFADHRSRRRTSSHHGPASTWRSRSAGVSLISSFKYKNDGGGDSECAVCLSVFEEGEQVKKLPKCNHSFHTPCIDMWLYSHMDCPLCRSPVEPPQHNTVTTQAPTTPEQHTITVRSEEHSREILLGSAILV